MADVQTLEEPFYLYPMKMFGVRELSRISQKDTKTVMKYLKELAKRRIIIQRRRKGKYTKYEANRLSLIYKHEKSEGLLKKIIASGLIERLTKELNPRCIVLFGSVQKGTYHRESDIDLFVQAEYKLINIRRYQRKLKHEINIIFEKNLKKLSRGLLENVCNGTVLSGKLEGFL